MGRHVRRDPGAGAASGDARPAPGPRADATPRRAVLLALAVVLAVVLASCGGSEGATTADDDAASASDNGSDDGSGSGDADSDATQSASDDRDDQAGAEAAADHAIDEPGPVERPLLPDDMLIYSQETLPDDAVDEIADMKGVEAVEHMSMSNVAVEARVITVAAVDPDTYRRFTQPGSAQLQEVWNRVAGGEMAINPKLGKRLQDEDGYVTLGNDEGAPRVHIGAYAPQVRQIDAVVNPTWAEDLGMTEGNALLLSTFKASPQKVRPGIQKLLGDKASVQILGPDLDISVQQTAVLTGGSVAQAVGNFNYRVLGGGRVQPDASWENANIRTESVPILGEVRCHKVMLPQLRAALTEVVARGLAAEINPGEYAGCYYPRFIAGTTKLSNHSFGTALDMNVPGNQRGTRGEMNREVVAIFKKWGFAWGGDWSYTDPMHFELARLVEVE